MIEQRRHWALAAAWMTGVIVALAWAESRSGIAGSSLAVGNFLLGIGFAFTAVLLSNQEGQAGNAKLFVLLTMTWVIGEAGIRGLGALTAAALFVGGFTQVVAGAVLLRYPGRKLERLDRAFVLSLAGALAVIQVGLIVTGTPHMWEGEIPDVPWPTLWASEPVNHALWIARYAAWGVAGIIFLCLLWRRWTRLTSVERRTVAPILLTAAAAAILIALRLVDEQLPDEAALVLATTRAFAATAVSGAFVFSALRMRLARGAVAELATELAQSTSVENVRDSLRRALADPTLDVWYWVPDRDSYVDIAGVEQPVPRDPDRLVAQAVTADAKPLAVVLMDPALRRHHELVDSAIAVSRLAMENAQLQASLRAQLVAVRDARSRLLHSGLEQRRRLERDLHDGAQQRLLAVSMRLGAIQNATVDAATAAAVDAVRSELHQALDELRDLARGLYPAVLSQAGLGPALEAVIERLPIPVHARVPKNRWHPDVESAAYLITCEALANACKHAGPCVVDLVIEQKGNDLMIDVSDDGLGSSSLDEAAALRSIHDRVDAMGGSLHVDSSPGRGTRFLVEIPCG